MYYNFENEPVLILSRKFLSVLLELKSVVEIRVLLKLLELSEDDSGRVIIPALEKKEIIEELHISFSGYDKAMRNLREEGIIKGERGLYYISEDLLYPLVKTRK